MSNRSFKLNLIWIGVLLAISLLSGVVLALGWFAKNPGDNVVYGLTVCGLPVGGLDAKGVENYLNEHLPGIVSQPIQLITPEGNITVNPDDLGIYPDVPKIVQEVMGVGRTGGVVQKLKQMFIARRGEIDLPLHVEVDQILLNKWLDDIHKMFNNQPVDAKLEVSDGKVTVYPEVPGYEVDLQKTKPALLKAVTTRYKVVDLPVKPVEPQIKAETIYALGIDELMGEYTTTFSLKDANRVNNITLAARALDGQLVAPGTKFSFNQTVGPRVGEAGYLEAPVIEYGVTVPGIGGGVCQVATTLYNAILLAGVQVDVRYPHSIIPSYVPLGMDATVSYGTLDLVFTNNTSHHLYIEAKVNQDSLKVAIYGEKVSKYVRLVNEVLEVIEPSFEENYDSALPKGTWTVLRDGSLGYKVAVWREGFDDNQELVRSFVGITTYAPRTRIVRVGTGE
jgi:vancomycin resistance protein YoaR